MDRRELLAHLGSLRRATVARAVNGGVARAPHKPLLVLWLLGQAVARGPSVAVSYEEARGPVGRLIDDFGPPTTTRNINRAAMPFAKLERDLWNPRLADGQPVDPAASGARLLASSATGRFTAPVAALLADPTVIVDAARLLLDLHFTPALTPLILDACGLELDLPPRGRAVVAATEHSGVRRSRRSGFAEEVLRTYSYACAACGWDGALGRNPVGLEAAHVRWHSHDGEDEVTNALTLCSLHHVLFDVGVLGLTADRRLRVSPLYVARSAAGRALDDLHGQPLASQPRRSSDIVDPASLEWHAQQVFKGPAGTAQR